MALSIFLLLNSYQVVSLREQLNELSKNYDELEVQYNNSIRRYTGNPFGTELWSGQLQSENITGMHWYTYLSGSLENRTDVLAYPAQHGTQICADNEDIAHGLDGIPIFVSVTPMNDTYDGKALFATVDWSNVDATNIRVGLYWYNGTAISDDIILVSWCAIYVP